MQLSSLVALASRILGRPNPVRLVKRLALVWFALLSGNALAQGLPGTDASFDHATTGFSLTAQHAVARCESCHLQGVFRGTPRECASCHRNSSRSTATQFPLRHIPTTQACDVCHRAAAWNVVVYRHQGVVKGTCLTCHNTVNASGKPAQHLVTTASCDVCHNTLVWTATTYNHSGVVPGTCADCHNGRQATGKRPTHIPTTASCDTCHTTITWVTKYDHSGVTPGSCLTCHNGVTTTGKGRTHIPTTASCETCHTNYVAFQPATMNHTGLAGQCSTCHNGSYLNQNAQSKPATHISTTAQCDSSGCHASTTTWATATFNHALAAPPVTVGDHTCANCHKAGGPGLSKPTNHIPTTNACDFCHTNFTGFGQAAMSHDGTAGQCSTCHGVVLYVGAGAIGKPTTHIADNRQCDTCHSVGAWTPATYTHGATATRRCSVCHNGISATGKNQGTHIPDNRQCDVCHTSTSDFHTLTMDHTGLGGQCSTCHSGAYISQNAQAKSASHQLTTAQCDTCHTSTVTWATATFNHAQATPPVIIGDHTCSNAGCHVLGGRGLPKPTGHIPTNAACDTCHRNFNAFRPAITDHTGLNGQCSTCHNGGYTAQGALGKHGTHVLTSAQCDSCHSTTAWRPAGFLHEASAVNNCSSCHGTTARGKDASHIPDNRQCDTCHRNYVAFAPATMSHVGLAGQCTVCHSGGYVSENAQTKSTSHIPTTSQCDSSGCHASTTTWATTTVNHALLSPPAVIGDHSCSRAGCHVAGGRGLPKPTNHIPTTGACDNCHRVFTAFAPATMSHTGTTGQCISCHNGGYTSQGADAKNTGHLTTSASCDLCHSTTAWKPATFSHSNVTPGSCATCHGISATGKPSGHIPTAQACDQCHRTTAWMPLITPYSHSGIASGTCLNCHVASYPSMSYKPALHIPTPRPTYCDDCHRMTAAAWLPVIKPYSHTGVAANNCTSCHVQSFPQMEYYNAATHMPTTAPCEQCHKVSDASFAFANRSANHTAIHIGSARLCANCHEWNNRWGLTGREPGEHRTAARMAPNSCDNSGCHSTRGF